MATVNVAVLDKKTRAGGEVIEILKSPDEAQVSAAPPGKESDPKAGKVVSVEQRQMRLKDVPIEDLPKVVDATPLKKPWSQSSSSQRSSR